VTALVARTLGLVPRAVVSLPPHLRLRLIALLAFTGLLVGGWFLWFRDSSLVAIEDVTVSGVTSPEADRIEAALTAAARDMTTLHLDVGELERAVEGFAVVGSVEATPDFPHGVAIRVVERRPVALLVANGRRVPVAGDGTILPDARVRGELPEIRAGAATSGARLSDPRALALTAVAGAAPGALRERLDRIEVTRERGIVVSLADGPEVVFGDTRRLRAKWIAATRVLAESSAQGAAYVDVRIPERPAAGGLDFQVQAEEEAAASAAPASPQTAPPPASEEPPAAPADAPQEAAPPAGTPST
jgi:cell division protein FtsQ